MTISVECRILMTSQPKPTNNLAMKKFIFLSIGMLAFALQGAAIAQTTLFTTYEDWSAATDAGWGAGTPTATSTFSTDASTVNGLGNLSTPGGLGTSGSLLINPWNGWGVVATLPSQGGNLAFLQAIDPGTDGNIAIAGTGEFYLDFSYPDNEGGSYFNPGILLQYDANGYFGAYFATSTVDLGFTDPNNGGEVFRATIPYPILPGVFNGLGIGIMADTDYASALGFTVDNLSVGNDFVVPEPGTIALIGLGLTSLTLLRRRRQS